MTHLGRPMQTVSVRAAAPLLARRATGWLIAILIAPLLLGFAYSAFNPLGEAPDEADHYAYAAYIGQEGRLPEGTSVTQAKHPPLYHLLAAAVAAPTGMDFTFLRANPDVGVTAAAQAPNFFIHTTLEGWPWRGGALAMHLGRLVSVLAGVVLVLATYCLGRALWPARPDVALAAAAFVAFLPESLFIGASMSNDMLAATFSALALWAAVAGWGWRGAALAGLCLGLGFVTKVSTVAVWPVAGLAIVLAGGRSKQAILKHLGRGLLAGIIALAVAAPWLARNWQLYGDPFGTQMMLGTIDRRLASLTLADLGWLARGWFFSFWGKFGGAGHLSLSWPFYAAWGLLLAGSIAGWLRRTRISFRNGSFSGQASPPLVAETSLVGWLVLVGAPVLVALSILSYSRIALGTDQGRLLFPALAPLGLGVAGGLAAWSPQSCRRWLAAAMTGAMAAAGILALYFGILQPFGPPPAVTPSALAAATPAGQMAGPLELVAVHWDDPPSESASPHRAVALYWRAPDRAAADLRVAFRIEDSAGNLVWEWKRSPGAGRYSTDRWLAGQLVADTYRVPLEALGQAARIEAWVYAFPDETPLGAVDITAAETPQR